MNFANLMLFVVILGYFIIIIPGGIKMQKETLKYKKEIELLREEVTKLKAINSVRGNK